MSGMEPMLIGAALGGGVSAARGGNPITGALLGGMGGGIYGAAQSAAAGAAGSNLAGQVAANPVMSYGAMNTAAGQAMANPGFGATLKQIPSALGTFSKENPVLATMALQTGAQMLQPQQVQTPPAGLMRGNPAQMQAPQYNFGTPNISLI